MINVSRNTLCLCIRKLANVEHFHYNSISTMEGLCDDAKKMFHAAMNSVQPKNLITQAVTVGSNFIQIQGVKFDLQRNIYVVGFGKAVLGMADTLENKLKDQIVTGILSIPEGSDSSLNSQKRSSKIEVYKGGYNNIPDEKSYLAARKISKLVESLTEADLLFVLISGGGSALLPSPKEPLTLEDKMKVIKLLACKGASIDELNTVRKRLSELKGGGLAKIAKPAKVISLILSDIIGDPLGLIASGPTVKNTDHPQLPLHIIEKYNLKNEIPATVLNLLQNITHSPDDTDFSHVSNFIIGNNQVALDAAAVTSKNLGYNPIIVSNTFSGIAKFVGSKLISLITLAVDQKMDSFEEIYKKLNLPEKSFSSLLSSLMKLESEGTKLCILLGGETTVEVSGNGVGGRNQELALAAAIELNVKNHKKDILLLSAGTDGIDGPTDAAGALATEFVIKFAEKENLDYDYFLKNNDSYKFYNKLCNGQYHIKTGHTGTNVMDIIIILIKG